MIIRILVSIWVFWLTAFAAQAQCLPSMKGLPCINNPIEFLSNTPGATMHSWDFNGEGFNNTSANPTFTFTTLGSKTVTYTCRLPSGQPCTAIISLVIKDLPKLRISQTGNSVQCFENNMFCFRDSSLAGDNSNCIKTIKYLFSDGELITKYGSKNNPVPLPANICKSYLDPQGGTYSLTVEIEDCNGCISKQTLPFVMKVELLPSIFASSDEKSDRCKGSVKVKFTNLSQISFSDVSKFKWVFGDGSSDSTSWDSVSHNYSIGNAMTGIFTPQLYIYTGNGCMRVFNLKDVVVYNFKPRMVKDRDSVCVGESIRFQLLPSEMQQHIFPEKVRWNFDPGGQYGYDVTNPFNHVGPHLITCQVSHICGPYNLIDTINVIGPKARIEPAYIDPTERYQCKIQDTVHVTDRSDYYHNDGNFLDDDSLYDRRAGNLKFAFDPKPYNGRIIPFKPYNYNRNDEHIDRIWDFDDPYCMPCTSDRKANMNVDLNCRYSKDTADLHAYTDWDSVYRFQYAKRPIAISYFDPNLKQCGQKKIWLDDSLYATVDSVIYYGNNALGISAKDSVLFSPAARKHMLARGMLGKGIRDLYHPLRVYIPAGSAIELDRKDGSPKLLISGPQYYNVAEDYRIITGETDTCLFVYGLKVFYDTIPFSGIGARHLQVRKVALAGFGAGDSINAPLHRRLFYETVPRCFRIQLSLRDTVHPMHCESIAAASVALLPPSAKKLSINGHYCYGYGYKVLELNLEDTKPGCMASYVQFNPDYIKNPDDWYLLNDLNYGDLRRNVFQNQSLPYGGYALEGPNNGRFFWVYNDTALTKKSVQDINVALIIGNGVDPNMCHDTVYYDHFAAFPHLRSDLVFAENMQTKHHVCSDTMVYATLPDGMPDDPGLADESSWYLINNQGGDTLERIDEYYHRVKDHWRYPAQKVNYTVIDRYRSNGGWLNLYRSDTIFTAIVHSYKVIALPGLRLNGLKNDLAGMGFDIQDFNDSNVLDLIWNRVGIIGVPSSGSRGCIDTTGYGHEFRYDYRIYSSTVLHYKDSSLLPADSMVSGSGKRKAYGFRVPKNGSYNIFRSIGSYYPTFCPRESTISVAVGFMASATFSDTIICRGNIIEATPDFRYYSLDSATRGALDTVRYWFLRQNQAGANNREGVTYWDYSKADDDLSKPATIFGSFPYVKIGYGNPGILLGNERGGIYYRTPGIYTLRVTGSDSNYCRDTLSQKIYVTGPRAGFYTDIATPNCKTILELFDTSTIVDPCKAAGLDPCDFIYKWTIDWGDGSLPVDYLKELPKQIGHDYVSNGYYRIKLVIESVLGCRDTVEQEVFIPGPGPLFVPESRLFICVGDSVSFRNTSRNYTGSSQWLWNFGDGFYSPQTDSGQIFHRYDSPGQFDVYLSQFDSIANTGKYCSAIYPDLSKGQTKITVTVWPYDDLSLKADKLLVCVGDSIEITATLDSRFPYRGYFWHIGQNAIPSTSLKYRFAPDRKGRFDIRWTADTTGLPNYYAYCPDFDTIVVFADSVLADFTIDDSKKPIYCFTNTSKWAIDYRWGFFHDTDITRRKLEFKTDKIQSEPDRYICQNFIDHSGINWVCLEALNGLGCLDTVCKKIENDFEMGILPPNVFTPNGGDGFTGTDKEGMVGNNVFNIYTKNVDKYHLIIYDRWGVKVFESYDQQYDWNGSVDNKGTKCPDGTYYYLLEYRYVGRDKDEPILNGVVKLIW